MAPQQKSDLQEFIANVRQRIIDGGRFSLAAFDKAVGDEAMQRLAGQAKAKAQVTRRPRRTNAVAEPAEAANA